MTRRHKMTLARILAAFVLFAAAELAPLEGVWKLCAFLVPYFTAGWDVLWRSAQNIAHGQVFDENFLMSVATVGAMATGQYAEGVAVMLFYQVGELFQSVAVGKSRRSIAALMDIRPEYANVIRDGETLQVDPEEVAVGETILIRPGERVPLDAVVIEGSGSVNTAAMTGESVPRDVTVGDGLTSGAINLSSVLKARTSSAYADSTVARVLDLVENSSERKARTENFITRFARYYTPAVVFAALGLALIPPLAMGQPWTEWIHRALVFLVVSCPCALVISVPLSFFGGIGGASRRGILVKGSNYLEALSKAETVVFDKTGTLTEGSFRVTSVRAGGMPERELLALAARAEAYSTHPVARAVVSAARDLGEGPDPAGGGSTEGAEGSADSVEELAGMGVRAQIDGRTVLAGNARLLESRGIQVPGDGGNGAVVHVAVDGTWAGSVLVSDAVKPDARAAVDRLHAMGVKAVMLTGDRAAAAGAVAEELGVDGVRSDLLPGDKVSALEEILASARGSVAFVGDGINDAPVLTRADVGLAMGALGSDAAIEAADMVLMDDRPSRVAEAIAISRRTMTIVRENIVFALAVKLLILVLGAWGLAGMWLAVFADVGVAILAILNALRAMDVSRV